VTRATREDVDKDDMDDGGDCDSSFYCCCDKIDIVVDDIDNDNNVSSATKLLAGHSYMSV